LDGEEASRTNHVTPRCLLRENFELVPVQGPECNHERSGIKAKGIAGVTRCLALGLPAFVGVQLLHKDFHSFIAVRHVEPAEASFDLV